MIFVEPEKRVRGQEIAHLVAPEIKNECAPVPVLTLPRIGVFVEIGAIKFRQRVGILGKMRRHPIHEHADPGAMTRIDEMPQFVRVPEPARRRVIVCHLIAPRTFEGMLGDRQQLDVGETHLEHIGQQRLGKFEVADKAIPLFHHPLP